MSKSPIEVTPQFVESMSVYRQLDKSKPGLLSACSENVVVFAEHMLGIKLYSWQVYFLRKLQDACANKALPREYIAMTSRQIGKSTATAVFATWACTFNKYPGTINSNTIIGITSASDTQAKKLLRDIKMLMHRGNVFMNVTYAGKFGQKFFENLLSEGDPNNTSTITFRSYNPVVDKDVLLKGSMAGSVIKSYAPTPTILGETFTIIIIDEAGRNLDITDEFFKEIITPTGNSTNALRVYLSTPWAQSGFFYELVDPYELLPKNKVDLNIFTIDAIKLENGEYYKTVKEQIDYMNSCGDIDEVQRAYYCRFAKGTATYFDSSKVLAIFNKELSKVDECKESCDMGIDFGGQKVSKTVITISRLAEDGNIHRIYHKSYNVGQDLSLIDDVGVLLQRFNVQRIIPDDCAQADFIVRQMVEKGWNVQPVSDNGVRKRYGMNFKTDKVKKYSAFRSMVHRYQVKSYADDTLQTEMLAIEQSEKVRNSNIEPPPGYHDDHIDSFVLSCYFFVQDDTKVKTYDW